MHTRRSFLGSMMVPAGAVAVGAVLSPGGLLRMIEGVAAAAGDVPPETLAKDEAFWGQIARAFTVDRSLVNLNNGGVSPAPAFVQEAMKRHLDFSNEAPPYTMWRILEPQREAVRQRLARQFGADPEEIALTRNASEGLQICQFGFDLEPGDEVLATNQDYGRMLTTFRQRQRREGIELRTFPIPVPADDPDQVVRLYEQNITGKTRLILMCHVINLTGQILPVREVVAMARRHDIPVIVDGAHALAHMDFTLADLDCDYYATSLHKWLAAPHGTGLLYVRKDKIKDLWPLMAAVEEQSEDIRKFEEIGTHPAAGYLAIGEALTFHQTIGPARKEARLRHLRDYWADALRAHDRIRFRTSFAPSASCGIATVEIDGIDSGDLSAWLWSVHRILVTSIGHEDVHGIRVTPNVYTTHEELDRFVDAMTHAIRNGLPS